MALTRFKDSTRGFILRHGLHVNFWIGVALAITSGIVSFATDNWMALYVGLYGTVIYEAIILNLAARTGKRPRIRPVYKGPLRDIAQAEKSRLDEVLRRLEHGSYEQYVSGTQKQVLSTFEKIFDSVDKKYDTVTIQEFWSPGNMEVERFIDANVRLAHQAAVTRYFVLPSDHRRWKAETRRALSLLYTETRPRIARNLKTYILAPGDIHFDWPELRNFALWTDTAGERWLVKMEHQHTVFEKLTIRASSTGEDIAQHEGYLALCEAAIDGREAEFSISNPRFPFRRRGRTLCLEEAAIVMNGSPRHACHIVDRDGDGNLGISVKTIQVVRKGQPVALFHDGQSSAGTVCSDPARTADGGTRFGVRV